MLSGLEEIHDQHDYNLVGSLEAKLLSIFLDHSLDFRFASDFVSAFLQSVVSFGPKDVIRKHPRQT